MSSLAELIESNDEKVEIKGTRRLPEEDFLNAAIALRSSAATHQQLKELVVRNGLYLTSRAAQEIGLSLSSSSSNIEKLVLDDFRSSADGLAKLALICQTGFLSSNIKSVDFIICRFNAQATASISQALCNSQTITELRFARCYWAEVREIVPRAGALIEKFAMVASCDFMSSADAELLLKMSSNIKVLDFSYSGGLGRFDTIAALATYIPAASITDLLLAGCGITNEGAALIGSLLSKNLIGLCKLDLSRNQSIEEQGNEALLNGLKRNTQIKDFAIDSFSPYQALQAREICRANVLLEQIMNATTVERCHWSVVLEQLAKHPNALFQLLGRQMDVEELLAAGAVVYNR